MSELVHQLGCVKRLQRYLTFLKCSIKCININVYYIVYMLTNEFKNLNIII